MDPLSLTASVITVIVAAQQVGKGLTLLKTAKYAPQGLDDLLSDVSRFELVLEAFKNVSSDFQGDAPGLMRVLSMAEGKLLEVNKLVQYSLTKAGESSKVDRWQWLRRGDEVGKLRHQLCGIQGDLTALISSNSFATLQQVSLTSQLSLHEQQCIRRQINGAFKRQEAMLALLCAKLEQSSLAQKELAWSLGDHHQSYPRIDEAVAKPGSKSSVAMAKDAGRGSRMQPQSVVRLSKCRKSCRCSCHHVQRLHIARFGSLEISGYRFPNSPNDCDVQSCEEPNPLSIKASIYLPAWIMRRMLSLWFTSSPLHGPELLLRVPRMISDENPIVMAVCAGDLSCFKRLVAQGQGSPYDVDEIGRSFAMRAMGNPRNPGGFQLLAYLLDLDVELAPCTWVCDDELTLSAACNYLIYCSYAMQYREFEPCLAYPGNVDWGDVCKELEFTELHKVIFGLSLKSLDAQAHSHAQDLNKRDLLGRTALYYACSFGREDYTRVLLSHGADPNAGASVLLPLVAAIRSESCHCVRLLLEHDATIPVQLFKDPGWSNDLCMYTEGYYEFAEADQMLDIDKLLLEHGLDFDSQSKVGYTALMRCCKIVLPGFRSFRKERLELLLELGIKIELTDFEGNTAISHAVMNANACAFKKLIHAGARVNRQTGVGLTILHLAVLYADNLGIIQALINTSTRGIILEARDRYGLSAFDFLRARVTKLGCIRKWFAGYLPGMWRVPGDQYSGSDIHFAQSPEEEAEILAAFDALFRKLQDERGVPAQARYPTSKSLIDIVGDEESESDGAPGEIDSIPGAWLE